MSYEKWWQCFDEDPYEKIGRLVPDTFGHLITVRLSRLSWAYLDWYETTYSADMNKFFQANHKFFDPNECSVDEWMEGAVNKTYLYEEKQGRPRPDWCPAATPAQYMDI